MFKLALESRYATNSMFPRHRIVIYILGIAIGLILLNFFFHYNSVYKNLNSYPYRIKANKPTDYKFDFVKQFKHPPNTINEKCDVIHIGFVCAGHKATISLHTLIKSLFFYRINPIHFHLIADDFTKNVLNILFTTWQLPKTTVSFYPLNDLISDIRWVPNNHYSGIFGLLKLVFPKIIPPSLTSKIIILDTDLTFVADIAELWSLFNAFNQSQAIGIVENQSNYYLGTLSVAKPWPAIGRGYNTGVMLFELDKLKRIDWPSLWSDIAKRVALNYGAAGLGDQDVMNSVIVHHPELVYEVPCYWNTQLSDFTKSFNCYRQNKVKIVHWNSPKKLQVVNQDGDYFRSVYSTFIQYNGNLLRQYLHYCNEAERLNEKMAANVCAEFRRGITDKWRTILFLQKYDYKASENDVTFIAQLSFDRLQMVESLAKLWEGPIAFTFYLTDPEFEVCLNFIQTSDALKERTNIAFHAVFKEGEYYPINMLRNVGLKNVNTPYVFLADADFLPMKGLYSVIKSYLPTKRFELTALIVPAFETQRYRTSLPRSKSQLIEMLNNKSVFPFRHDVWAPGHAATNYTRWRSALHPYKVKWEPDFEPYFVVASNVTAYDNRFMGFGWNKVSHVMELEAQGYEWIVLPNAFMVHKAHAPSYDIAMFRSSSTYRMCLYNLKEDFVQELHDKYKKFFEYKSTESNFKKQ